MLAEDVVRGLNQLHSIVGAQRSQPPTIITSSTTSTAAASSTPEPGTGTGPRRNRTTAAPSASPDGVYAWQRFFELTHSCRNIIQRDPDELCFGARYNRSCRVRVLQNVQVAAVVDTTGSNGLAGEPTALVSPSQIFFSGEHRVGTLAVGDELQWRLNRLDNSSSLCLIYFAADPVPGGTSNNRNGGGSSAGLGPGITATVSIAAVAVCALAVFLYVKYYRYEKVTTVYRYTENMLMDDVGPGGSFGSEAPYVAGDGAIRRRTEKTAWSSPKRVFDTPQIGESRL